MRTIDTSRHPEECLVVTEVVPEDVQLCTCRIPRTASRHHNQEKGMRHIQLESQPRMDSVDTQSQLSGLQDGEYISIVLICLICHHNPVKPEPGGREGRDPEGVNRQLPLPLVWRQFCYIDT